MSLRTRLVLLITVSIAVCVGLVTWIAGMRMRAVFEANDTQHTAALVAQFQQEFHRRGEEVISKVDGIASRDSTVRIALEAARPQPDYSIFVDEARSLAEPFHLDFLEFVAQDGTIISSAHWPARFGYKEEWLAQGNARWSEGAFLKREELPDGVALALVSVRPVRIAESTIYVVGGIRLDRKFLASLVLPNGMRALLYTNTSPGFSPRTLEDAGGPLPDASPLQPFIQKLQSRSSRNFSSRIMAAGQLRNRSGDSLARARQRTPGHFAGGQFASRSACA